jgi:O-antigen/teichoic acid export membrane protein
METPRQRSDDLSGRDRLAWNVLTIWGSYVVFLVAGFLMLRLIDRYIGQTALGVWDFGWSIVGYFSLAQVGVRSSINRSVARTRSTGDVEGLRQAVSSVAFVNLFLFSVVVVATGLAAWSVPAVSDERLGEFAQPAATMVALLGASIAVQMAFDPFRGVLTGCHRWDLHNAVSSGAYLLTTALMILALTRGGGRRSLALAYLVGTTLGELLCGPPLGALVVAVLYWRLLLSPTTRRELLGRAGPLLRRLGYDQA